jgi:hypothetical protein
LLLLGELLKTSPACCAQPNSLLQLLNNHIFEFPAAAVQQPVMYVFAAALDLTHTIQIALGLLTPPLLLLQLFNRTFNPQLAVTASE